VADRTGHRSSQMIARYRRRARLATELELGWFKPLHEVVPELAQWAGNDQQLLVTHSGATSTNDEDLSDVAEVSVVGHEGLASGGSQSCQMTTLRCLPLQAEPELRVRSNKAKDSPAAAHLGTKSRQSAPQHDQGRT